MNYIPYLFFASAWAGILLCLRRQPLDLKARAALYLEKYQQRYQKTALGRTAAGIKAKIQQEQLEKELAENLAYIKNLVVLGRGRSISAELLLTELSDASDKLASVYIEMAGWLHTNEKDLAAKCFSDRFDTGYAIEIGRFLAGWEDISPSELLPSVELYQSALREERMTRQQQRDEAMSDLVYFPVVLNCMAVLLNFIYVAYFLSQRDALGLLIS